ncbi:MAG: flagellin [Clostridiales bacterium]|jgi:flagellin|nr:flagellin [Clostridiales bacterium]
MVVNTNVLALNSHRALKNVGAAQAKASARLSSGTRVNSAADDAAGLAISEKMRAQISGLDMASKNTQDGISLVQTAEGGMEEIGNMLKRARELAVQAGNDTNTATDRDLIEKELDDLGTEIDTMASKVQFNGMNLLDETGGTGGSFTFQVGANQNQTLTVAISSCKLSDLNAGTFVSTGNDVSTNALAGGMLDGIDTALDSLNELRAGLGAKQNRMEYTMKSLDISSENLSAAESRIRDTDMAKEMMNLTRSNVLQQAATSMLSQANQAPQNVLSLLR